MQTIPIDWHISVAPSEKNKKEYILEPMSLQEYTQLANWLNIEQISNLEASFFITRKNSFKAILKGNITALVQQLCIRSLEPIEEKLHIELFYHLTKEAETFDNEAEISEEDVEYWDGKNLDLGKIISEELLLHINPYPKKTDAILKTPLEQVDTSAYITKKPQNNPFEVLKKLKYGGKDK